MPGTFLSPENTMVNTKDNNSVILKAYTSFLHNHNLDIFLSGLLQIKIVNLWCIHVVTFHLHYLQY